MAELEKEYFKLGLKSSFFYDPTQPEGDGKVLPDQLVELVVTPRVEAAINAKGLLRATKADIAKLPAVLDEQAQIAAKHAEQFKKPVPILNVLGPAAAVAPAGASEEGEAGKVLLTAHSTAESIMQAAREESQRLISQAHERAHSITQQATAAATSVTAPNPPAGDAGSDASKPPLRGAAAAAAAKAAANANPTAAGTPGNPTPAAAAPNANDSIAPGSNAPNGGQE